MKMAIKCQAYPIQIPFLMTTSPIITFFWFDPPFVTVPFCAGWTEEQWLMKAQELLKTYGIDTYGSPAVKLFLPFLFV